MKPTMLKDCIHCGTVETVVPIVDDTRAAS